MEVIIERTSLYEEDVPPIEGARQALVTEYDYRLGWIKNDKHVWDYFCRSVTDIEELPGGKIRGRLRRQSKVWVIDIPNIYEFTKLVGQCVVTPPGRYVEPYPIVEIYDDYRE